jgi:ATP-dependent helicase HrpA
MLERQARDLSKSIAGSVPLLLSASPYINSEDLTDTLLQLAFRGACFGEADAPRTRAAYELAVDRGRERLYASLEEASAMVARWLAEAQSVRQVLDDPRIRLLADAAEETRQHLRRLLDTRVLQTVAPEWLRQLPRYLKAELRRWQRNAVRGGEPPNVARELQSWSARHHDLERQLGAELRWTPKLDEFRFWIEEYRVSLYAQELKTLAPISATRLQQRAAEIDAWIGR